MERIETDVLVAGGGIAGLVAASAFASAGFDTLCIDAAAETATDRRSTAFLMPAVQLLRQSGLWPLLQPVAAPLQVMRIIDADPESQTIRESADFIASDIGAGQFGFNVPNTTLRETLARHIGTMSNARLEKPASFETLTARRDTALVRLSDGRMIAARLVIAADGKNSAVRQHLGIAARRWRYGQNAIACSLAHALPHQNITTEIHASGGPFTLVPLADPRQSALVWMDHAAETAAQMVLSDSDFAAAAGRRACHALGPMALAGPRASFPIAAQLAARLDGPRTALVAEAAHVVPPIGAQGLNMSLSDIALLLDLATAARREGRDIGDPGLLSRYSRQRLPVLAARVAGIDALNRAAMVSSPLLRDLRRAGLHALATLQPARRAAMRLGMG